MLFRYNYILFILSVLLLSAGCKQTQLLDLAEQQLDNKEYRKAIYTSNAELARSPNSGRAYYIRGQAFLLLKDFRKALDDLKLAEQHGTDEATKPDVVFHVSLAYDAMGDLQKAILEANRAVKLDPSWKGYYRYRAGLHRKSGDLHKAIRDMRIARSKDPEDLFTMEGQVELLVEAGFFSEAKRIARELDSRLRSLRDHRDLTLKAGSAWSSGNSDLHVSTITKSIQRFSDSIVGLRDIRVGKEEIKYSNEYACMVKASPTRNGKMEVTGVIFIHSTEFANRKANVDRVVRLKAPEQVVYISGPYKELKLGKYLYFVNTGSTSKKKFSGIPVVGIEDALDTAIAIASLSKAR